MYRLLIIYIYQSLQQAHLQNFFVYYISGVFYISFPWMSFTLCCILIFVLFN